MTQADELGAAYAFDGPALELGALDLPEMGDVDKPKLVFFFDEAHLLLDDASKAFLDAVAQTVRLIRSKGVGVFFVTQTPKDVPPDVLAQLGNPCAARPAGLHPG